MKLIQISPMGNLANRMIQYMVALALAARVPDARIVAVQLPEWGIEVAPEPDAGGRTEIVTTPLVPLASLALALSSGTLDVVDIRTYGQMLDNFLPASAYHDVFRAPAIQAEGCRPDELLINIRQGDILDAHHPDYVLVPADFYAELLATTGLRPVFLGQLDASPYLDTLKYRFPRARFVPSGGALVDLERIRRSVNIVSSVSTFGWLAAWLSGAERVFLPVLGLLHPLQCRSVNLLPLDDPRYEFILFPHHYAVPVAQFAPAHRSLRGLWRKMPPARLSAILTAPPPPRTRAANLLAFDERFYLTLYPDIAAAVDGGHFPSARDHYERFGFDEGRAPCSGADSAWYCRTYPIAALELGQGDAVDPTQHWIEIGQFRGYKRSPAQVSSPHIM